MTAPKFEWTDEINFGFHVEGNQIVIDECEGITPEEGLAMFPKWALEAAAGAVDWSSRYPTKEED